MTKLPTYLVTSTKCPLPDHARLVRIGDYLRAPEMSPDEPTIEIPAWGIAIGMMIGIALWLVAAWVLWVTFFGGI